MNSLDLFELAKNLQVVSKKGRSVSKNMFDLTKKDSMVNLNIHLLLLRLIVVKEISLWMMKVFH